MGNRKLYNEKKFLVNGVLTYEDESQPWHLEGVFAEGSVKCEYRRTYRVRVQPDARWKAVQEVKFVDDHVYETESIGYASRRHIYGSGQWYISPFRPPGRDYTKVPGAFTFDDVKVTVKSAKRMALAMEQEKERIAANQAALKVEAVSLGLPETAPIGEILAARLP